MKNGAYRPDGLQRDFHNTKSIGDLCCITSTPINLQVFDSHTGVVKSLGNSSMRKKECEETVGLSGKHVSKDNLLSESFRAHAQFALEKDIVRKTLYTDALNTPSWSVIIPNKQQNSEVEPNSITQSVTSSKIVNYNLKRNCDVKQIWDNPVIGVSGQKNIPFLGKERHSMMVLNKICNTFSLNKDMLRNVDVFGQIEKKFISCSMRSTSEDVVLVLVDQHAADERVRLENILREIGFYTSTHQNVSNKTTRLSPPLQLFFHENEIKALRTFQKDLLAVGLSVTFTKKRTVAGSSLFVSSVPSIFVSVDKHQALARGDAINTLLIKEFILEQLNCMNLQNGKPNMASTVIFKVAASYACHGAIKFGDELSLDSCKNLMLNLSQCDLPFQCAHGRPSVAPLISLSSLKHFAANEDRSRPKLYNLFK